ncbi:MAG TPA: phage portal protein, partial [Epulopiscium sp.]|nr:phage portal protein [Candidatus Epulonipiscium sp.]
MGLISWIANKFGGTIDISKISKEDIEDCVADIYIRELALNSTINLIAGVFCKAEFKTYDNNEEIKKDEYYLWNISPNKNQSA